MKLRAMGRRKPESRDSQGSLTQNQSLVRHYKKTTLDFSKLALPRDIAEALAEAFWNHCWPNKRNLQANWSAARTYARFIAESSSLDSIADLPPDHLAQYVQWLNAQKRLDKKPLAIASRASSYTLARSLIKWHERCSPGLLPPLNFPINPFPYRNRQGQSKRQLTTVEIKKIISACKAEIVELRRLRESSAAAKQSVTKLSAGPMSLGQLLRHIKKARGGIIPKAVVLAARGNYRLKISLEAHGGLKAITPLLGPTPRTLFPYFLLVLLHCAGNLTPILELSVDCLQPLPLLKDRELVVWRKRRSLKQQRRSFARDRDFEPPALIREVLEWSKDIRQLAPKALVDHLFICRSVRGVGQLTGSHAKVIRNEFCAEHDLKSFSLSSIRSGVLSAFYLSSGQLTSVRDIANHANVATTIKYVRGPQVEAAHNTEIKRIQSAFSEKLLSKGNISRIDAPTTQASPASDAETLLGFNCKNPLEGIAPGSQSGKLCTQFLSCLSCPNAILPSDPGSLAKILRARDHLETARQSLNPARFEVVYAPVLRILKEDVLTKFGKREIETAARHVSALAPLPEFR